MFPSTAIRLLVLAVLATGTVCAAAEAGPSKEDAKAAAAAKEQANKAATSTSDIKKLIEEASKQRDALIADHEATIKQLKDATEEQKKALKEKMEEQKKVFDEVMKALHRQIRDEQRKQRAGAGKR